MRWRYLMMIVLTLPLTACSLGQGKSPQKSLLNPQEEVSSLAEMPDIPFSRDDAFYPLRKNPDTQNIVPSYSWRECSKRIIFCVRWSLKIIYFEDMTWFHANGFGLTKRQRPK